MKADPPIGKYITDVTAPFTLIARAGFADDVQDLLRKVYRMGVRRGRALQFSERLRYDKTAASYGGEK